MRANCNLVAALIVGVLGRVEVEAADNFWVRVYFENDTTNTIRIKPQRWTGYWNTSSTEYKTPGWSGVIIESTYMPEDVLYRVLCARDPYYPEDVEASPGQVNRHNEANVWTEIYFSISDTPPGPATNRLKQCVFNSQNYPVTGYWRQNGVVVHSKILMPGEQECYTFTYSLTGTNTLESGFTKYDMGLSDYGPTFVGLTNWSSLSESNGVEDVDPDAYGTNVSSGRTRTPYTISSPGVQGAIGFGTNLSDRQAADLGHAATVAAIQDGDDAILAELIRIRLGTEVLTNLVKEPPDTNGAGMSLDSAEGSAEGAAEDFDGMGDFVSIPSESAGSAGLTLSIPIRDLTTLNANPLTQWSGIGAGVASAVRTAMIWFLALWVFTQVFKSVEEGLRMIALVPQATTAGQSAVGTNANIAGALTSAGMICATIAVAVVLAVAYVQGFWPEGNPLTGVKASGAILSTAVYWADQFFPLSVAFVAIVEVYGTKIAMLGLYLLKSFVIKFLVGI